MGARFPGRAGIAYLVLLGLAHAQPMLSLITQEGGYEFEDLTHKRVVVSPYVPYENALAVERGVSEAWNYYDAQVYFRTMAALYGKCSGGQKDALLDIWEGKTKAPRTIPDEVPEKDYCDGQLPRPPVEWRPLACPKYYLDWTELNRRLQEVGRHALSVYHPRYLDRIGALLERYAPKGVSWPSYRSPQGAFLTPVKAEESPNWKGLVEKALTVLGAKGEIYIRQAEPGQSPGKRTAELGQTLTPPGGFIPPGVQAVERLKPQVVDRLGVHDRPLYWAGNAGGPVPTGQAFAGPPGDYEIYGLGAALFVYARPVQEVSPRVPTYQVGCYTQAGAIQPILIPLPTTHNALRVNTAWFGLVEGYPVPKVSGVPTRGVR